MKQIDKTKPVMVTGANGYVASWVVKRLVDEGITIHATVRDPGNPEKLKYLNEATGRSPGKLIYFKADLLEEGSFADAMKECEVVYHTASPFILHVNDPQKDLIEPALLGTQNVLEQVNNTESVKRVVLTSSCAAIYGDNADLEKTSMGMFTEENWNESSTPDHLPYSYSKTVAEKEAWKINKAQDRWDLVVVNPSLVIGPGINPVSTSESFRIIKQFGDGTMKTGAPDWGMGVVDVRDLAEAHFKAGFTPSTSGRYIISAHNTSFIGMVEPLIKHFGNAFPFPKRVLPKLMVWLIGPILNPGITRKAIRDNVNYPWRGDNTKSIRELGMSYRALEDSMVEYFQQLIDHGIVKPKSKK